MELRLSPSKRGGSCMRASIAASTSVSPARPCVCVRVCERVQRLFQIYVETISRRTGIKRH